MSSTPLTDGNARPAPPLLARYAAAELLADALRHQILEGTLRPGDPLRESDIATRYGVARNTVREALRLLTRDGLGVHEVHRGVAVRTFVADEVRDIFELRRIIEESAAERAGTLENREIDVLEGHLRDSEEAFANNDHKAGLTANLEFHRALVRLARNPRTDAVFDQLLTEIRLILSSMEDRSGGPWLERNRELFDRMLDGDAARFRATMREYIAAARDDAIERLPAASG